MSQCALVPVLPSGYYDVQRPKVLTSMVFLTTYFLYDFYQKSVFSVELYVDSG